MDTRGGEEVVELEGLLGPAVRPPRGRPAPGGCGGWKTHAGALALVLAGAACMWLGLKAQAKPLRGAIEGGALQGEFERSLPPDGAGALAGPVNELGLALLSAIHANMNRSSVFISPVSIVSALGLISLGATPGGDAEEELMGALGLNATASRPFFEALSAQAGALGGPESGVQLLSANSVWCKGSIKATFVEEARAVFHAEANPLPADPAPINSWCSKATHEMVPSILEEIDPLTVAVLVNAVYFKGMWASKFEKKRTQRGVFKVPGSGETPCAMMWREDKKINYFEEDGTQIVELPYGGDGAKSNISAFVLLPTSDNEAGPSRLVAQLGEQGGAATLARWIESLRPTHVSLKLPRFKVEFGVHDLKQELNSSLGVAAPFAPDQGAFMAMTDDRQVYVSSILHKAVVDVNEEGTTAAAVTAGVMMTRSIAINPRPPKKVVVDRPFVFLIRDVSSGVLHFAGVVEDPEFDMSGV